MISLLRNRRSIRKYRSEAVEDEKIALLEEAALLAPTSRNFKPTRFLFVSNSSMIQSLAASKQHGSSFLAGAPLCIVVCGDEQVSDVWVEDASIASVLLQMTAQSLGLGSCWIQIRKRMHQEALTAEDYVKQLLDLPAAWRVESLIAIGYPDEEKDILLLEEKEKRRIQHI